MPHYYTTCPTHHANTTNKVENSINLDTLMLLQTINTTTGKINFYADIITAEPERGQLSSALVERTDSAPTNGTTNAPFKLPYTATADLDKYEGWTTAAGSNLITEVSYVDYDGGGLDNSDYDHELEIPDRALDGAVQIFTTLHAATAVPVTTAEYMAAEGNWAQIITERMQYMLREQQA